MTMAEQARRREPLAKLKDQWAEVEELVGRTDFPLQRLRRYDGAMDMDLVGSIEQACRIVRAHDEDNNLALLVALGKEAEWLDEARTMEAPE